MTGGVARLLVVDVAVHRVAADGDLLRAVRALHGAEQLLVELGRLELARGEAGSAAGHFKAALRADPRFTPAVVALGDAYEAAGDAREAVRTWERAVETQPALPLLARLERAYREQGRPSRMIALYRSAAERAPDDLALAAALGRVYFELEARIRVFSSLSLDDVDPLALRRRLSEIGRLSAGSPATASD